MTSFLPADYIIKFQAISKILSFLLNNTPHFSPVPCSIALPLLGKHSFLSPIEGNLKIWSSGLVKRKVGVEIVTWEIFEENWLSTNVEELEESVICFSC